MIRNSTTLSTVWARVVRLSCSGWVRDKAVLDTAGLRVPRRRGFTLMQVLIVVGLISILATMIMGVYSRGEATARRGQCDIRLKAIVFALDAYRQENGRFPATLANLRTKKYLMDEDALRCPADPRPGGSYEEYYINREPLDTNELPIVVCPFHENDSKRGVQAYKGRYTKHFMLKPAQLVGAINTTVQSPARDPVVARAGMKLHGGDRIRTGAVGAATIRFADGSISELLGNSDVTVLQSFLEGQSRPTLYTLVRQTLGIVTYRVSTDSKFDVVTPTATAGALGTVFEIEVDAGGAMSLLATKGNVALTTLKMTVEAPLNQRIRPGERGRGRKPRER